MIDCAKRRTSSESQAITVFRFKLFLFRYVLCETFSEKNESMAVIHKGQSEKKVYVVYNNFVAKEPTLAMITSGEFSST